MYVLICQLVTDKVEMTLTYPMSEFSPNIVNNMDLVSII